MCRCPYIWTKDTTLQLREKHEDKTLKWFPLSVVYSSGLSIKNNWWILFGHTSMLLSFHQIFKDHAIDGETLPLLTEEHLLDTMGLKLGPALKIRSQVISNVPKLASHADVKGSEAIKMFFFQTKPHFFLVHKLIAVIVGEKKFLQQGLLLHLCMKQQRVSGGRVSGLTVWEMLGADSGHSSAGDWAEPGNAKVFDGFTPLYSSLSFLTRKNCSDTYLL